MKRRSAFTLVELLVVVGIISVLVAILLPALNKARDSATRIKCASSLRQIGLAVTTYANNFRGWLPPMAPSVWWDSGSFPRVGIANELTPLGYLYEFGYLRDLRMYFCPGVDQNSFYNLDQNIANIRAGNNVGIWYDVNGSLPYQPGRGEGRITKAAKYRGGVFYAACAYSLPVDPLFIPSGVCAPHAQRFGLYVPSGVNVLLLDGSVHWFPNSPVGRYATYSATVSMMNDHTYDAFLWTTFTANDL